MQTAPQMNNPGHGGYVGVDQEHVVVHFDSAHTVSFPVPIVDFENAVKANEPRQISGMTLKPDTWQKPAKFLWWTYTKKTPMIRIWLHRSLGGRDLMIVKRQDLLQAIRDVC
jgi:hypothetical protein